MTPSIRYQRDTNGHPVDWGIIEKSDGALIFSGKSSSMRYRITSIPAAQWNIENRTQLVLDKLDEGYKPAGLVLMDDKGKIQPVSQTFDSTMLSWEISEPVDPALLLDTLTEIYQAFLTQSDCPLTSELDLNNTVLHFRHDEWRWEFGYSSEGGLLMNTNRGAGSLNVAQNGIAPLMTLLKLRQVFGPCVQFCWGDGKECDLNDLVITPRNTAIMATPYPWIWTIAGALGLVFEVSQASADNNGWF